MDEFNVFNTALSNMGICADEKKLKALLSSGIYKSDKKNEKKAFLSWCLSSGIDRKVLYAEVMKVFASNTHNSVGKNIFTIVNMEVENYCHQSSTCELINLIKNIIESEKIACDCHLSALLTQVLQVQQKMSSGEILEATHKLFICEKELPFKKSYVTSCAHIIASAAHSDKTLTLTSDVYESLKRASVFGFTNLTYRSNVSDTITSSLKHYKKEIFTLVDNGIDFQLIMFVIFGVIPSDMLIHKYLGNKNYNINNYLYKSYLTGDNEQPYFSLEKLVSDNLDDRSEASELLDSVITEMIGAGNLWFLYRAMSYLSNCNLLEPGRINHKHSTCGEEIRTLNISSESAIKAINAAKMAILSNTSNVTTLLQYKTYSTDAWYDDYQSLDFASPIYTSDLNTAWTPEGNLTKHFIDNGELRVGKSEVIISADYIIALIHLCKSGNYKAVIEQIPFIQSRLVCAVSISAIYSTVLYAILMSKPSDYQAISSKDFLSIVTFFSSQPVSQLRRRFAAGDNTNIELATLAWDFNQRVLDKNFDTSTHIVRAIGVKLSQAAESITSNEPRLESQDNELDHLFSFIDEERTQKVNAATSLLLQQLTGGYQYITPNTNEVFKEELHNDGLHIAESKISPSKFLHAVFSNLGGRVKREPKQQITRLLDAIYNSFGTTTDIDIVKCMHKDSYELGQDPVYRIITRQYEKVRTQKQIDAIHSVASYVSQVLKDVDKEDILFGLAGGFLIHNDTLIIYGEVKDRSELVNTLIKDTAISKIQIVINEKNLNEVSDEICIATINQNGKVPHFAAAATIYG